MSNGLKENPEQFWPFIKRRKQDSGQIVSLKSKDGLLHNDSQIKASILNNQFQPANTKENLSNHQSDIGPHKHPTMHLSIVHERVVKKLFWKIKPHKATGPDDIHSFILKAAAGTLPLLHPTISYVIRQWENTKRLAHSKHYANIRKGRKTPSLQ